MDRRAWLVGSLGLLAAPRLTEAQGAGQRVHRMGYLDGGSLSSNSVRIEALRQGLRELGYIEGQNIAFEWRSAEGKAERLPGLAAELVRLKVDVIVTGGAGATRPAKDATATIPIVMARDSEPVGGSGFVASLARPGGNVTGLSTLHRPCASAAHGWRPAEKRAGESRGCTRPTERRASDHARLTPGLLRIRCGFVADSGERPLSTSARQ